MAPCQSSWKTWAIPATSPTCSFTGPTARGKKHACVHCPALPCPALPCFALPCAARSPCGVVHSAALTCSGFPRCARARVGDGPFEAGVRPGGQHHEAGDARVPQPRRDLLGARRRVEQVRALLLLMRTTAVQSHVARRPDTGFSAAWCAIADARARVRCLICAGTTWRLTPATPA